MDLLSRRTVTCYVTRHPARARGVASIWRVPGIPCVANRRSYSVLRQDQL
jgi:hypothetical protein